MLVLHEHPLSPYAQKVKIALREKGLAFEPQLPDIIGGATGEYAALNPRLEVPTLVDGDVAIFDSTIILEYLEERHPEPPLLPRDPAARARARMLEEMCDTYYEAINWAVYEVRVFQRASGELAEALMARADAQRAGANTYLERALGAGPWFGGTTFGWADLAILPVVNAAALSGTPPPPGSPLASWLDRARERPSVAETFAEALASMTGFEMLPQLVASGHFRREYRDHRLEWMVRSGGLEIVLEGLRRGNIRFSQELA